MNYYIADLHIAHKNVCKEGNNFDNRPFETMEEMMKTIKDKWNSKVTVSTLKGNKHLILGNNDKIKDSRYAQLFVEITHYKEVHETINGIQYNLMLSHCQLMFWNHQHRLKDDKPINIHFYAHLHNTVEETIYQDFIRQLNEKHGMKCIAKNVGCMLPYMDYEPKSAKEILF